MNLLFLGLLLAFLTILALGLMFIPFKIVFRPTLNIDPAADPAITGIASPQSRTTKKTGLAFVISDMSQRFAVFNKPFVVGALGQRLSKDLAMARVPITPEEFILLKEAMILGCIWLVFLFMEPSSESFMLGLFFAIGAGYFLPEFWVKGKIGKVRDAIVRDLPDTVDLLGLCVNAGLDFMMALKYVIEKSAPTVIIQELSNMIQEINVGKPRREALRDMARRYDLPDLSTFARTLIQADRMGTSVSEALNILSEDMRDARFRRGEQMAMKAPLKMLIPLLLFIFPVVAILVAGPVFLDFFQNNPLEKLGGK